MKLCGIFMLISLTGFLSCKHVAVKVREYKSDTTKVIELGLRTAFYHQNLPEVSEALHPYHYKDSILLSSDSFLLPFLPVVLDTLKFKILSQKQLDSLFSLEDDLRKIPHHLLINSFEKTDTGYYIGIQSIDILPIPSGGQIGINISKVKDSFIVKNKMSSSIN